MNYKIVGMVSSYAGLTQADWLWNQSPMPFGQWKNIQLIAQHPKPNYLLLYQFDFHRYLPRANSWKSKIKQGKWKEFFGNDLALSQAAIRQEFRGVPKERIFYSMREPPLPEVIRSGTLDYQCAKEYTCYATGPSQLAPMPDYMPAIWYVNVDFNTLNASPPPKKVATCSWITSGINRTENHRNRLRFLRSVCDSSLPVDIYGRNLPDWSGSLGSLNNKWFAMSPYFYNLAVENYADNDLYVSEKLWDALLSWCLPIYYGGSAADRLLPPGSFLKLPSLDAEGLSFIEEVISSPDAWYEAKEAIAEARQIILHKLNLLNWLDERISVLSE